MHGKATDAQIGAFLIALKFTRKEQNPTVVATVAKVMRSFSVPFNMPSTSSLGDEAVLDIVGTGGDGMDTFNVSTASSLVVAGCGCFVAKVFHPAMKGVAGPRKEIGVRTLFNL
ncbi:hypothetical protein HDU96_007127 [Phlyctochytrium bullatum]|nr:hypothetical protein HDU96_007127 [Phlyctochytrium bullatum]